MRQTLNLLTSADFTTHPAVLGRGGGGTLRSRLTSDSSASSERKGIKSLCRVLIGLPNTHFLYHWSHWSIIELAGLSSALVTLVLEAVFVTGRAGPWAVGRAGPGPVDCAFDQAGPGLG